MPSFKKTASVTGLLTFGTMTSLFAKIVYEIQSTGEGGELKFFRKPWAMTSLMFLGMSLCLPLAYMKTKKTQDEDGVSSPLLDAKASKQKTLTEELRECLMLAIPTVFDLLATVLMNVGLLSVTASVYQMMRGAEMLFAALFAIFFLKRKLNRLHVMGIAACVKGIILVGSSSLLSGEGGAAQKVTQEQILIGMGLIVLSQAVQAAQLTFEDFFMADLNIEPIKIVGFEGLFGVILTMGVMMPIAYFLPGQEGEGIHEDSLDTIKMIMNSSTLQIILLTDMVALLMYNISGMMVTGELGAVFRTVLETMRTLFVWLVDLLLFYTPLGGGKIGESWNDYSYMQALGFCILVGGTVIYGRGDEKALLEEAEANQANAPLLDNETGEAYIGSGVYTPDAAGAVPIAAPTRPLPSEEIHVPSFKANQTIQASSYSRSIPKSLGRGGMPPLHLHTDE